MKLLYALRFLTVLPIPYRENENLQDVARSTIWYPAVGLLIGGALYPLALIPPGWFTPQTAAVLILALWTVLTGGLHLDGLADLADGLGGGRTREEKLSIMKDSRSGVFAVLALVVFLLAKWALITELLIQDYPRALLIAPTAARLAAMLSILRFPSAREGGLGAMFKQYSRTREPVIGTLFCAAAAWLFMGAAGIAAAALAVAAVLLMADRISRKLQGLTGDVYGAVTETAELLVLLLIPIAARIIPI